MSMHLRLQVNLPGSSSLAIIKKNPAGESPGRSLLCIASDHNPNFGHYFQGTRAPPHF
jgi:hypothetical protein